MTSMQFDRTAASLEIEHIVHTYPEVSDRGDLAGVGEFMDGVRFGMFGIPEDQLTPRPAADAAKMYGESVIYYPDGISYAKHLITNLDVAYSDDGQSAQARSTYVVLQVRPEFPFQVICTGGYEDTLRPENGRWKLDVRREWMDIKGDLTYHVRQPSRIEVGHGPAGPLRATGASAAGLPPAGRSSHYDEALDVEQIRRIILSYPERVDRGDFAGVGELLAGVRLGGAVGRNAPPVPEDRLRALSAADVEGRYRSSVLTYKDGLPGTKHVITNIDISFSDDASTASARSYYTVLQALEDFPLQIVISGRYEDVFLRTADGWRLDIRREYADLVGDLSRHVSAEAMRDLSAEGI
jgi:3-phenylpropionate/cinnamic acid dioxygenase small subunit